MSSPDEIRADLEPQAEEALVAFAIALREARPLPRPSFRGELGRQLAARARPAVSASRLRASIAAGAAAGIALLCIGTVSAAGIGPLG